ncbi:hypothetical protein HDU97_004204 [Phlyctochytrium planicorne]|nr:hypothetical protein HDU97_004204 [Phlyctochytrium planicorne]
MSGHHNLKSSNRTNFPKPQKSKQLPDFDASVSMQEDYSSYSQGHKLEPYLRLDEGSPDVGSRLAVPKLQSSDEGLESYSMTSSKDMAISFPASVAAPLQDGDPSGMMMAIARMVGQTQDQQARRIEELENEVATKSTLIQNLQSQTKSLTATNSRLQSDHSQIKSDVLGVHKEHEALKEIMKQNDAQRKELEKKCRDFDSAKVKLEGEITSIREDLQKAIFDLTEARAEFLKESDLKSKLQTQLDLATEQEETLKMTNEELSLLLSTLKDEQVSLCQELANAQIYSVREANERELRMKLQEDVDRLKLDMEASLLKHGETYKQLQLEYESERETYVAHHESIVAGYSEKYSEIIQNMNALFNKRLAELIASQTEERQALNASHARESKSLDIIHSERERVWVTERTGLLSKLESFATKIEGLENERSVLLKDLAYLQQNRKNLDEDLRELKGRAEALSFDLSKERESKKSLSERLRYEDDQLEKALTRADQLKLEMQDRLKTILDEKDVQMAEIVKLNEAILKYEAEVQSLTQQVGSQQDELQEAKKSQQESAQAHAAKEELDSAEIHSLKIRICELEGKVSETQSNYNLESKHWQLRETSIIDENISLKRRVDSMQKEQEALKVSLNDRTGKIHELEIKSQSAESTIKNLEAKLASISTDALTFSSEKSEIQAELAVVKIELEQKLSELATKSSKFESIEKESYDSIKHLQKRVNELVAVNSTLEKRCTESEVWILLTNQLEKCMQDLKSREAENDSLRKELKTLQIRSKEAQVAVPEPMLKETIMHDNQKAPKMSMPSKRGLEFEATSKQDARGETDKENSRKAKRTVGFKESVKEKVKTQKAANVERESLPATSSKKSVVLERPNKRRHITVPTEDGDDIGERIFRELSYQ